MAHKRKDTFADTRGEYSPHLKKKGKRLQSKAERRISKEMIQEEAKEEQLE